MQIETNLSSNDLFWLTFISDFLNFFNQKKYFRGFIGCAYERYENADYHVYHKNGVYVFLNCVGHTAKVHKM